MSSAEYRSFYEEFLSRPPLHKDLSLKKKRDAFEHWLAGYPPPSDIRFEPFIIGPLSACWAFAREVKRQPIVLFFHGGGYVIGSVRSHWGLMGRLSRASGCAVLGINYRLAPENPFPAALEDALTAYRWLLHHPYPHNQIALAGASAGGGLLLALMLRLKLEQKPMPAAAVCLSPWVDLSETDFPDAKDIIEPEPIVLAAKAYGKERDLKDPFISPTYGDLHGLPPLYIQAGGREILLPQIEAFAAKTKKNGVKTTLEKWSDMVHTWQLFANRIPEGQEAIEQMGAYLRGIFQSERA